MNKGGLTVISVYFLNITPSISSKILMFHKNTCVIPLPLIKPSTWTFVEKQKCDILGSILGNTIKLNIL